MYMIIFNLRFVSFHTIKKVISIIEYFKINVVKYFCQIL